MKKLLNNSIFKIIVIIIILFFNSYCISLIPKHLTNVIDIGINNYGIDDIAPVVIREKNLLNLLNCITNEEKEIINNSYKIIKKTNLSKDEYRNAIKKYPALINENIYVLKNDNQMEINNIFKKNIFSLLDKDLNSFVVEEYKTIGLSLNSIQSKYITNTGIFLLVIIITSFGLSILSVILCLKVSTEIINKTNQKNITLKSSNDNLNNSFIWLINTSNIVIVSIISIIRLFKINMEIGSIILIINIITIIITIYIIQVLNKNNNKINIMTEKVNNKIKKIISNIIPFKKHNNLTFLEKIQSDYKLIIDKKNKKIYLLIMPISILILFFSLITINIIKIKLSIGLVIATIIYIYFAVIPILIILNNSDKLLSTIVIIKELIHVKNLKSSPNNKKNYKDLLGTIEFRNVFFKYEKNSDYILNAVSFIINLGEKVTIIGKDNEKEAIISLILRLYNPTKGKILIDGIDIKKIPESVLSEKIGYIKQDNEIVKGSILLNLTSSKKDIDIKNIETVCELVDIKYFIDSTKEKYNYKLLNNISTGQRQKIIIAREIIKNPNIFIFDNAFSNISKKTEEKINDFLSDKTIITISKRLPKLVKTNKIIIIENKKLIGIGNNDYLLKNCDQYAHMFSQQLEGDQ